MSSLVEKLQDFINKNRDMIAENPHILVKIKQQLAKAYGDDDDDYDYDEGGDPDELRFGEYDDVQDYGDEEAEDGFDEDEDLKGLSTVTQDELEGDDADRWLAENDPSSKAPKRAEQPAPAEDFDEDEESRYDYEKDFQPSHAPKVETKKDVPAEEKAPKEEKKFSGKWKPNEANYKPEHTARIGELINSGFSHREAERIAGAHAGPSDFEGAFHGSHDQEEPSAAFFERLMPHVDKYIGNWESHKRRTADATKNPELYHAGKISEAVQSHRKPYEQAWKDYQDSDEFKNMDMFDQMDAQAKFKKRYHEENPEHLDSFINMSTRAHKDEAKQKYQEGLNAQLESLLTAHMSGPETMSSKEVGQHLGGEKTEGGGYTARTKRDPMASFAEKNPHMQDYAKQKVLSMDKYQKLLSPEQMDRLSRVHGIKGGKTGGENA